MSNKSFLDNMFDAADAALTPLEKVLSKEPSEDDGDVDNRQEDWEKSFNIVHWATVDNLDGQWHALRGDSMVTICGKTAKITSNRQVLDHGKFIPACTSCIIGVSK